MKISEFANDEQIDELNAQDVGTGLGKGVRAVGTGVKNFAKGFGQGLMGKVPSKDAKTAPAAAPAAKGKPTTAPKAGKAAPSAKPAAAPAAKAAQPAAGPNMDTIKSSVASFNPKQRVAIRQQAAKKAGVV